jgi:N-acetylglucosaminyl-diphospho-decaprenol L-rhamnosyltransferase
MSFLNLSAVIVNFRTPALVINCVKSIVDLRICRPSEIYIVDNFSNDGSSDILQAQLPDCQHITMRENRGYSAGVNAGVRETKTDFVLCLNPDTYFVDNTMSELGRMFSADERLALIGLDLRYPTGERQFSARRKYSVIDIIVRRSFLNKASVAKKINDRHLMVEAWSADAFDADWVLGTGFVVRRTAFNDVGGMDEGYFLYMEDVDLCQSLRDKQWRVQATSMVKLVHDHQRASAQSLFGWSSRTHLKSLWRYYRKHGVSLLPS